MESDLEPKVSVDPQWRITAPHPHAWPFWGAEKFPDISAPGRRKCFNVTNRSWVTVWHTMKLHIWATNLWFKHKVIEKSSKLCKHFSSYWNKWNIKDEERCASELCCSAMFHDEWSAVLSKTVHMLLLIFFPICHTHQIYMPLIWSLLDNQHKAPNLLGKSISISNLYTKSVGLDEKLLQTLFLSTSTILTWIFFHLSHCITPLIDCLQLLSQV